MKVLQINTLDNKGSTGKIARELYECASKRGHKVFVAHRYKENDYILNDSIAISTWLDCHVHNRLATITGLQGCFSIIRTKIFLAKIKKLNPDLIHLHNIHGSFINHKLLFRFIKKYEIPVIWTLHDCWSFTGGCPHFIGYDCQAWEQGCRQCPYFANNRNTIVDLSSYMWRLKKELFSEISNMTLVCPSQWLIKLVEKSYMKNYPVLVIRNGINLDVFRPTQSDLRKKYNLKDKYIILGVSFVWNEKKGIDVFCDLAKRLDSNYKIILVGVNDVLDKTIPDNILTIPKIENQRELAALYSLADVFVNPTREDTYPTVNMEALACGTPVVTYKTGGSEEMLDRSCGIAVPCDDLEKLIEAIIQTCENNMFTREDCLKRAQEFDNNLSYMRYIELYENVDASRN